MSLRSPAFCTSTELHLYSGLIWFLIKNDPFTDFEGD